MKRPLAVFKSTMLPKSETFVRTQGESLRRYEAHYIGLVNQCELTLPPERWYLLEEDGTLGKAKVVAFKMTGRSADLIREMRTRRIEIVHAHFGTEAWRAMRLSVPLGLPTVVTFHGADITTRDAVLQRTSSSGRQYVRHRQEIFCRAARCIAVSEYVAQRLVSAGCPPHKVVVHRIGVDSNWFRPPGPTCRKRALLFVGRLVEKKGVNQLLEALHLLHLEDMDPPPLTIAGDGPQRPALEAAAKRLRLQVDFIGHQDHCDIRTLMHTMTALVVPSHQALTGESEGLPTVIREAQASGLPVIATQVAGAPEAVTDNVDGLLVEAQDPAALASRIKQLFTDAELQESLARCGLKTAAQSDISIQAGRLESIYDDVRAENMC